ncbi:MAG: DMT family transporter, partial [Ruminococcaceae bacterium]|nr:DMT family transporter [Oscillospiraceae bacterium]
IAMFILEKPVMSDILDSWISILYAGILSSGVAYTLQILGQKYTPPTIASMLMSLESAFAVLSAIVFSSLVSGVPELPTGYEWIGIILMFSAIMISQLPQKKEQRD